VGTIGVGAGDGVDDGVGVGVGVAIATLPLLQGKENGSELLLSLKFRALEHS